MIFLHLRNLLGSFITNTSTTKRRQLTPAKQLCAAAGKDPRPLYFFYILLGSRSEHLLHKLSIAAATTNRPATLKISKQGTAVVVK